MSSRRVVKLPYTENTLAELQEELTDILVNGTASFKA